MSASLPFAAALQAHWRTLDRKRKWLWAAAAIVAALHIAGIVGYFLLAPDFDRAGTASWFDLSAYLDSADAMRARAPLYTLTPWPADDIQVNQYHPLAALAFSLVADLPFRLLAAAGVLLQAACYLAAWPLWYRLLRELGLHSAARAVLAWLPLALVYINWFTNMYYWNITSTLILVTVLLLWALAKERMWPAVLLALPLALTKPFWLFPLLLPVILRRWRFLARVLAGLVGGYVALNLLYLAAVGVSYGVQTLRDYVQFLTSIPSLYPWEDAGPTFMHLNHSWRQIFYHYAGLAEWVPAAAMAIQALMVASLAWAIAGLWRRRVAPDRELELAMMGVWLGYLVAMAMLDQLWELSAGVLVFMLLQSSPNTGVRRWSRLFLLYALSEILIALGLGAGLDVIVPHEVFPATMAALLVLYGAALAWLARPQEDARAPQAAVTT